MRDLIARTPLRVRLVAAVLVLVTLALLLISVASVTALRAHLVDRVDTELASYAQQISKKATELGSNPRFGAATDNRVAVPSDYYVHLYYADGVQDEKYDDVRFGASELPKLPRDPTQLGEPGSLQTVESNGRTDDGEWRVYVGMLTSRGGTVVVAASLDDVDSAVSQLAWIDVVVGAIVLAALAIVGVALVRASLRPLVEIERTAAAIAAGDLSRRVPQRDPRTEVGRLARTFNVMLGQIEHAFRARAASERAARGSADTARRSEDRMRRFVADASHELRTPLTTIRGFSELYRQGALTRPGETDQVMRRIEAEADRMGLLVEDLLLLARIDQQRPLAQEPVDLLVLAADAIGDIRAVDPERPIRLVVGDGPLVVCGDEGRLRQVFGNLLSNARLHTPANTPVEIRLRAERDSAPAPPTGGWVVAEVADSGPGLTHDEAERVFERFYRVDPARSRRAGGTGLGLAIVAALVAAHGGIVDVATEPGKGAVFTVWLPLAPPDVIAQGEEGDADGGDPPLPDDRTTDQRTTDDRTTVDGAVVADGSDDSTEGDSPRKAATPAEPAAVAGGSESATVSRAGGDVHGRGGQP